MFFLGAKARIRSVLPKRAGPFHRWRQDDYLMLLLKVSECHSVWRMSVSVEAASADNQDAIKRTLEPSPLLAAATL